MNQLTTGTDYMYTHKNKEVHNLKGKLNILHHLVLQKAKDTSFDLVNELNPFKDKLIESLGSKASKWQPPTPASSSSTVTTASREKRDIVSVGTLFQLAGFALSLINRKELVSIKAASEDSENHQRYVAAKAEESLLRLSNLTLYTKTVYDSMLQIIKTP